MKFLAFTDIHEDQKSLRALVRRAVEADIDFVICTGDFSNFGRGMANVLREFNALGKNLYFIPGNHEEHHESLDKINVEFPRCFNLHCKALTVNEYVFLGYGGGGFAQEDAAFRKIAREWYGKLKGKKIVFLTHGPAFNTTLDLLHNRHVGNKDYRKFIERINPKLVISGHLHETVGQMDTIGKTKLVNPGWEGMVIELK